MGGPVGGPLVKGAYLGRRRKGLVLKVGISSAPDAVVVGWTSLQRIGRARLVRKRTISIDL
jgi:hypothetical protein